MFDKLIRQEGPQKITISAQNYIDLWGLINLRAEKHGYQVTSDARDIALDSMVSDLIFTFKEKGVI